MSTKAGTIGPSARSQRFGLWMALLSAVAVTALILSAVALGLALRSDERVALSAPRPAIASQWAVTGTGPGLIEVAQEAERTAALRGIYSGERVTGTGPGLARVAIDTSMPQVTGTGPGLAKVAEQSQGK